jgi:uncharacterized membrane protein YphA (DoxX/SURF4 family)
MEVTPMAGSETPVVVHSDWSHPVRVAFRFVFAYLFLFIFPFPIGTIPGTTKAGELYRKLWDSIVPWTAKHVLFLQREVSLVPNGSGDKTYDYIVLLVTFALAVLIALVWSLFSRRREHSTLYEWLRVYVRYYLAATMLTYGMSKVFKSQFPMPTPMRLMQPIGDSSPMGLLWTFMGFSMPYTFLAGAAESVGGLLLLFRRTTMLGSLFLLGVMGNVVALNFCYDVPVKLYSVHLWLMAAFLLLPDVRRLADFFVFHRAIPAPPATLRIGPRWRIAGAALKFGLAGLIVFMTAKSGYDGWRQWGDGRVRQRIEGAYEVGSFAMNGVTVPLSTETRWRKVGLSRNRLVVRRMNDSVERYRLEHDEKKARLVAWPDTSAVRDTLMYAWTDSSDLMLGGVLRGDSIQVAMRKVDATSFPLMNRGFHWINELPFNR